MNDFRQARPCQHKIVSVYTVDGMHSIGTFTAYCFDTASMMAAFYKRYVSDVMFVDGDLLTYM